MELIKASQYDHIRVKPIGGVIGAEIEGVDLARLDDRTFAEIDRAFADHSVVFFRNQQLSPDEFERFGERLGQLTRVGYMPPIEGSNFVHRLVSKETNTWTARGFGDNWHQDQTIRDKPNSIFSLYSIQSPPQGGDTMFTSLYAAFETLSPELQRICEQLTLIHCPRGLYGDAGQGGKGVKKPVRRGDYTMTDEQQAEMLAIEMEHPLVVVHPVTGRKLLFISGPYAIRFGGMSEDESEGLIQYLYRHAQRPEFAMRWRWNERDVAVIDNRCLMHFAVQDYAGYRREMLRLEVAGERPVGPASVRITAEAAE